MEDVQDNSTLKFSPEAEAHLDALEKKAEPAVCKKCHGEGRVRSVACDHEGCYGDCGHTVRCSACKGVTPTDAALIEERKEHAVTRQLYTKSIQDRVQLKEELNKVPPVDMDVLGKFIAYALVDVSNYDTLTVTEKTILTEVDYEALRNWALRYV